MVSKYYVSATGTDDDQVTEGGANVTGYNLRLMGVTVQEDAAGAAKVILRNGIADTAGAVAAVFLAANASGAEWFGPDGIHCPDGIFIEKNAGTTTVTVCYTKA